MSGRYSSSAPLWRHGRNGAAGTDFFVKLVPDRITKFTVDQLVKVRKTGVTGKIVRIESWGDYVLEGIAGSFTGEQLEAV